MTLTISHTRAEGTLIDGTAKGDGTNEILKANRWRWSRNLGTWYVPHSRDKSPKSWVINSTATALREAGHEVELDLDDTARATADVEADKADRAEARAEALEAKAERKERESQAAYQASRATLNRLPEGGEPIKIGHHSESRHRNAIDRAHKAMGRSVEADREAQRAAERAETAKHTTGARYNPATVSNRIDKIEAEIRKYQREINGYTAHKGSPYASEQPPATGERLDRLKMWLAEAEDQLAYWKGVREEQIASGEVVAYSKEMIKAGDMIKVRSSGWWFVVRANAKTVSVESHGCSTRAPYGTITGHRTAEQVAELQAKLEVAKEA